MYRIATHRKGLHRDETAHLARAVLLGTNEVRATLAGRDALKTINEKAYEAGTRRYPAP